MNRDKIRKNINTLFNYARNDTDNTSHEREVKQAYQSTITELQSDVAVMRKITPETKFKDGERYLMMKTPLRMGITIRYESDRDSFFNAMGHRFITQEFTHYLQIELEE